MEFETGNGRDGVAVAGGWRAGLYCSSSIPLLFLYYSSIIPLLFLYCSSSLGRFCHFHPVRVHSPSLALGLLQSFGQELRHILELGGVLRAEVREYPMGLDAGVGHFFLGRVAGRVQAGLGLVRQGQGTLGEFEEVKHAESFEQLSDARVGVDQFDAVTAVVAIAGAELKSKPSQDAEKGAVHERTLCQVEHEVATALLAELVDEGLEINARGEIGPPDNPDAGASFARPYQHPGRRRAHAFPPTICTSVCCTTSDSSRLVETSRRLHWNNRSMARTSSASL